VKRGLVPEQWPWSSFRWYASGEAGPVRINEWAAIEVKTSGRLTGFPPAHPFAKTAKGLGTPHSEVFILPPQGCSTRQRGYNVVVASTNVRVRYRPARIGWCIRDDNWDDLRRALKITHILWGGKFNPVIPIGAPHADELVPRFRVDVLLDITDDLHIKSFMGGFKHLPWPLLQPALLSNSFGRLVPNFLDVSHPLVRIAEEVRLPNQLAFARDGLPVSPESNPYAFVHWGEDDPLKDVMLATFGAYPSSKEVGRDYERFLREHIQPFYYWAKPQEAIPALLLDKLTPSEISALDLNWDRVPCNSTLGFYAGRADDFQDIVNYWNLRAAGLNLMFLDPAHAERLAPLRESHSEFIKQRRGAATYYDGMEAVWSRSQEIVQQLAIQAVSYNALDDVDIPGDVRPPLHYFSDKTVLASQSEEQGSITLSFQLPEKPFRIDDVPECGEQHFVVSVVSPNTRTDEASTFWIPYIPSLNVWYGRNVCWSGRAARAEADGIGIIRPITDESVQLTSIPKQELAAKLFELAGIDAKPSVPGRIASRVISQLGGLQACKVLKIAGVRRLLKRYGPLEHFDRTEAIRIIGNWDSETKQFQFSDYENLFIEQRRGKATKLKPADVFLYLLEKGLFRAGLVLVCPICELPSWVHLDDVSTQVNCELCGRTFNVVRQLKTRDWMYRRSGLFGKENNQEGGVPVALTLQQLDANLSTFGNALFLANMCLTPGGANIQPCETDIFVAMPRGEITELAVGECKDAGGKIELDDAQKLAAVADSFPSDKFHSYIIFAKTGPFTQEEIDNCRVAQRGLRVIMLSDRELEPYFVYEKTSQLLDTRGTGGSFHGMARATHDVFFNPKIRKTAP
jgi:hypothetical protein